MKLSSVLILTFLLSKLSAQDLPPMDTLVTEIFSLKDYYGHAAAITEDFLLIIGGQVRTQASPALKKDISNDQIILLDWTTHRAILAPIAVLAHPLAQALAGSNMQYFQEDDLLYIVGGYGYSEECRCWKTHPVLIILEISHTIQALLNNQNPSGHMRYLVDERLAVTDGFLEKAADHFFLLEGRKCYKVESSDDQAFYFVETYDNQVRSFKIGDDGVGLSLEEFIIWTDLEAFFSHFEQLLPETYFGTGDYRFKMKSPNN